MICKNYSHIKQLNLGGMVLNASAKPDMLFLLTSDLGFDLNRSITKWHSNLCEKLGGFMCYST